jgi:branched-chain amino acid transport system permease protein
MMAAPAPGTGRAERSPLRHAVRIGFAWGVVAVYLAIVGLLQAIQERWIIVELLSLGHAAPIAIGLGAGIASSPGEGSGPSRQVMVRSLIAGAIAGFLPAMLVLAMGTVDLRSIFLSLSPALFEMLTFGLELPL